MRSKAKILFVTALFWMASSLGAQEVVRVAAAANLSFLADPLKASFAVNDPKTQVQFIFGASGGLTTQITQGAPYDVFMSADTDFPQKVYDAGFAVDPPRVYALGRLALFSIHRLDFSKGLAILRDNTVSTIAIANPSVAPYGRAAMEVLDHAGLNDVKPKVVYSGTIAQAVQFAITNATAAFINQSAVYAPEMTRYSQEGVYWIKVDPSLHSPIAQAIVVLKHAANPEAARSFLAFILSPDARTLFARYGYATP